MLRQIPTVSVQTMLIFLCFLLVFTSFLLLLLLSRNNKDGASSRKGLLPPGPPRFPVIGNLHQLGKFSLHRALHELSRRYGPLMSLQLGCVSTVVVSSARMAREVLKTHDLQFADRPFLVSVQKLTYNGLDLTFSPYGEYWRELRKICIIGFFSIKRVQSFQSIREDEVSILIKSISQLADSSKLVNLSKMMFSTTSNIICGIAFGKNFHEEGCERSTFYGLLDEYQVSMGSFAFANYFPSLGWILDTLTGFNSRLERIFQGFDSFFRQVIEEHLDPKRLKHDRGDITDLLLQMHKDHTSEIDLTLDHIKAVMTDILLAGTDTTTATLVWAMTFLAKHPRVMEKAQEEVRNLIRNKQNISEYDLHQLHYLKCVVKETLRLQPAAPLLVPRESRKQCNLDGYKIHPKTQILVNAWTIGRDPEFWENPEEFRPERFINSSIDFKGQCFEYIPFGSGRRICPGINFGMVIVELVLANLLYSFDWELPPGIKTADIDMEELSGLTVHKKNALCLLASNYTEHCTSLL
ncbi:PREDICTED: cytochrome P450 71A1-like [Nelumbo nucifera]|uniref:Cytochrome P450 71A1-like n=1 Tax=Nelumbo nucifera TaxID=4432 RepID=A0A1U8B139_NELNU|nr:PREDICTED: cytochrome P450 71A1-like [Nelumbo nucifera]